MQEIKIKFNYNPDVDYQKTDDVFIITVPDNVAPLDVARTFRNSHHDLMDKLVDENGSLYETDGQIASVLVDYVCKLYGWDYKLIMFDVELNFDEL